jgi:hypothetical protein
VLKEGATVKRGQLAVAARMAERKQHQVRGGLYREDATASRGMLLSGRHRPLGQEDMTSSDCLGRAELAEGGRSHGKKHHRC